MLLAVLYVGSRLAPCHFFSLSVIYLEVVRLVDQSLQKPLPARLQPFHEGTRRALRFIDRYYSVPQCDSSCKDYKVRKEETNLV